MYVINGMGGCGEQCTYFMSCTPILYEFFAHDFILILINGTDTIICMAATLLSKIFSVEYSNAWHTSSKHN